MKKLWKMEHLLFWSKCSIFHNIFKYMIFQKLQKALIWSKGLKESKTCIPYCIKQNFSFVLYGKHQLNTQSLAHLKMLTLCLLVPSADNLWKQFGHIPGPTKGGSNLVDNQMPFPEEFFQKVDSEKFSRQQKSIKNFPGVRDLLYVSISDQFLTVLTMSAEIWVNFSETMNRCILTATLAPPSHTF